MLDELVRVLIEMGLKALVRQILRWLNQPRLPPGKKKGNKRR